MRRQFAAWATDGRGQGFSRALVLRFRGAIKPLSYYSTEMLRATLEKSSIST